MLEKGGSSASRFRIQRGPKQVKRPPRGRPLGPTCVATAAPRRQSVQPRRWPRRPRALTAALARQSGAGGTATPASARVRGPYRPWLQRRAPPSPRGDVRTAAEGRKNGRLKRALARGRARQRWRNSQGPSAGPRARARRGPIGARCPSGGANGPKRRIDTVLGPGFA